MEGQETRSIQLPDGFNRFWESVILFGQLPELFKMISYEQDWWSSLARDPMTLLCSYSAVRISLNVAHMTASIAWGCSGGGWTVQTGTSALIGPWEFCSIHSKERTPENVLRWFRTLYTPLFERCCSPSPVQTKWWTEVREAWRLRLMTCLWIEGWYLRLSTCVIYFSSRVQGNITAAQLFDNSTFIHVSIWTSWP